MPDIAELEIPEIVQDYIEPIPGGPPAGTDANNEEEYFVLNMEIPKNTPDYKKCIELSAVILKEKSKDIKIATWLCFAFFRTEKIKGLLNGMKIIYHLLKKYGNDLFPANPVYRSKAIQFLNQPRFFKLVEREVPVQSNAKEFLELGVVFDGIVKECENLFASGGNVPSLKFIAEVIQSHVETANELMSPSKEKEKPPAAPPPEKKAEPVEKPVVQTETPQKVIERPVQTAAPPAAAPIKVSNENEAVIQLRQMLIQFFEYQADGAKKEKVPESYFVFGISRQLQWGKLFRPPETEGVTQIEAANSIITGNIKKWFETSDWDTLIPRIEINFLKADSAFPYWLDIQKYVTKALEQKGGNYILAAKEIKHQLAELLDRIPDLQKLKFKDKVTPFADDDTLRWIYDDVLSSAKKSDSKEQVVMPPIMGEEYEQINFDYKQACSELPKNIEKNIASMQKAIESDDRRKGKFLRRLNLANYCMQAKLYDLARIHLTSLSGMIDEYNLLLWEPALCTAVWQSLYQTDKELISAAHDKEEKLFLEKEQKELFTRIAKYDSIIAIKLKQKK